MRGIYIFVNLILKLANQVLQVRSHLFQFRGRALSLANPLRSTGRLGHTINILSDFTSALCGLTHITANLSSSGSLFLNSTGNGIGNIIDLIDDHTDFTNGLNCATGIRLYGLDFDTDIIRSLLQSD